MLNKLINFFEGHRLVRDVLCELFDVEKFLSRAQGVQALIDRGGSEGEKAAAREAMARMKARAEEEKKELSPQELARFEARFAAILNGAQEKKPRPQRPQPENRAYAETPRYSNFKVGDRVKNRSGWVGEIIKHVYSGLANGVGQDIFHVRWITGASGIVTAVSHLTIEKYDTNTRYSNFKVGDHVRWMGFGDNGDAIAEIVQFLESNPEGKIDKFVVRWLTGPNRGSEDTVSSRLLKKYNSSSEQETGQKQEGSRDGTRHGGWMRIAEFREGTSDKVYVVFERDGKFYSAWGRRDGPYATKQIESRNQADIIFNQKIRKGYKEIDSTFYWRHRILQYSF